MIPAKRFDILSKETNVALADYLSPISASIYSSPNLEVKEVSPELSAFMSRGKEASTGILDQIKSAEDGLTRIAKDSFSSLKDIKKLGAKDLDTAIEGMFPTDTSIGAAALSAYKKLAPACRTAPMGRYSAGKPYNPKIDCNGSKKNAKSGGCSPSAFSNVLDKLTNGAYKSAYQDLNGALSSLVSLATQGYNMNLCGVFSALSGGLPTNLLGRGAGMLLGTMGSTSNLRGVFDLAKSTSGKNMGITKEYPGAISNIFNNFKKPFDTVQKDYPQLSESVDLSMAEFDPKWNKSKLDDALSCSYIDKPSVDYNNILRGSSMSHSVSEDDLDLIPSSITNLTRSGLAAKSSSASLSYLREFTTIN